MTVTGYRHATGVVDGESDRLPATRDRWAVGAFDWTQGALGASSGRRSPPGCSCDISMRYVLPAGAVPFHALEVSLQRVDYDVEQHQDYARGRALSQGQVQVWLDAFAAVLPERRPLVGLDVGSGTGRYTPALARAFGPTTGVEPSVRMREVAQAQTWASEAGYVAGSAEALPAASESADYALLSGSEVQRYRIRR